MDFIHRIFGHGAHTVDHSDRRARLEELSERYRPVLRLLAEEAVYREDARIEGERLVVRGRVRSEEARAAILRLADLLDENRRDLVVTITVEAPPPRAR
jgi:hypothetical protein